MRGVMLFAIYFYQIFLSSLLKNFLGIQAMCRYSPSCSEYTKQSIERHGIIKGVLLGVRRILYCNPLMQDNTQRRYQYGRRI